MPIDLFLFSVDTEALIETVQGGSNVHHEVVESSLEAAITGEGMVLSMNQLVS